MADSNNTNAIIPSGSQLNDPVAAGQADAGKDPFNNPNWLASEDEFKRQPALDADPNSPGIDMFSGHISDIGSDITLPGSVKSPESQPAAPSSEAPVQPATPIVPLAQESVPAEITPVVPLAQATPAPTEVPLAQPISEPEVIPNAVAQPETIAVPESIPAFSPEPLAAATPEPLQVPVVSEPVVVDPQTLAVAATTENSRSKALNNLVDQVIAPKTRKNIGLIIIFTLLILVFLLASATVYLMLRGPVNVTINTTNTGNQSSSQTSTTQTSSTTTSVSSSAAVGNQESIYTYMVMLSSDNPSGIDSEELPEGSIELSTGYLVKVLLNENKSTSDPVNEALSGLLEIKEATYGEENYRNYLSRANLTVESTPGSEQDTEWMIDLVGEFVVAQDADMIYAKQQIERTIENYTLNYRISLNGSESEYRCLGSSDSECR